MDDHHLLAEQHVVHLVRGGMRHSVGIIIITLALQLEACCNVGDVKLSKEFLCRNYGLRQKDFPFRLILDDDCGCCCCCGYHHRAIGSRRVVAVGREISLFTFFARVIYLFAHFDQFMLDGLNGSC